MHFLLTASEADFTQAPMRMAHDKLTRPHEVVISKPPIILHLFFQELGGVARQTLERIPEAFNTIVEEEEVPPTTDSTFLTKT